MNWIKNNARFLSLNQIEKELNMPQGTLCRWLSTGVLPNKWVKPLDDFVEGLRG